MRTCTKCRIEKPLSAFWRDKRRKNGLQARCSKCRHGEITEWRRRHPEFEKHRYWANPRGERERHLVRKYGVTLARYEELFRSQDGKCAVCGKTQQRAFDVDHDHAMKVVRGLLCTSCNRMIGHAGDSEANLRRAADYLESTRTRRSRS